LHPKKPISIGLADDWAMLKGGMMPRNRNRMGASGHEFTQLLSKASGGDKQAVELLFPLVYDELHRLAHRRTTAAAATLNTTALVHEAYIRLSAGNVSVKDRLHFMALAARTMRMVLVDHVRTNRRHKRGGGAFQVTLVEGMLLSEPNTDVLVIDEALNRLAEIDARQVQLIELHYFGGMSYPEIANELSLSEATVHRRLRAAKAWLTLELGKS
jgi:RNA polymerase sigma factor (TIGR02999 family)